MARRAPPPERQRGRELTSLLVSFGIVYLLGRQLILAWGSPPFLVLLVTLVVIYVAAYLFVWYLAGFYWRR
jgi:hypothetical protein